MPLWQFFLQQKSIIYKNTKTTEQYRCARIKLLSDIFREYFITIFLLTAHSQSPTLFYVCTKKLVYFFYFKHTHLSTMLASYN